MKNQIEKAILEYGERVEEENNEEKEILLLQL